MTDEMTVQMLMNMASDIEGIKAGVSLLVTLVIAVGFVYMIR